jgi:hypothetical protein
LTSNGIAPPTCAEKPGWRHARSFRTRSSEIAETGQQALPEQLHDHITVPGRERVKGAVVREGTVGQEDVSMRMPL